MHSDQLRALLLATAFVPCAASALHAQPAPRPERDSLDAAASCTADHTAEGRVYERCALGIAPVWNGLAVVRGATAA